MMEERYSKLEITPKLIDFGSRVVQTKLVGTAGVGTVYPWRDYARPAFVIGLIMLVSGFYSSKADQMTGGPMSGATGILLLAGLAIGGGAIAAWFYGQRLLIISPAGGDDIILTEAEEKFLDTVVDRIREAMLAPVDAPIHYSVNIASQSIEVGSIAIDNTQTSVVNSPGSVMHSPGAVAVGGANSGPISAQASGNVASAGSSRVGFNGSGPHDTGAALAAIMQPQRSVGPAMVVQAGAGAVAVGGGMRDTSIVTQVTVVNDLSAMIGLIERARHHDQAQIIEYLRLLQQLAAAGPSPTAEARTTWLTFFDYAAKALTGVDGFITIAERVHRWFTRG